MNCPHCKKNAEIVPDYMDKPMSVTQLFDKVITTYSKVRKAQCDAGHVFFVKKEGKTDE